MPLLDGKQIKDTSIGDGKLVTPYIKADGTRAFTGNQSLGSNRITALAPGISGTDGVNVDQLNDAITGLSVKAPARLTPIGDIGASYASTGGTSARGQFTAVTDTVDGFTVVAGDRILVMDQTNKDENGIYVVTTVGTGANGVWDRATDFDEDAEAIANAFVFVEEGTIFEDTAFVLTTDNPITIGGVSGTDLDWAQFAGPGTVSAGDGLDKTGSTLSVKLDGDSMSASGAGSKSSVPVLDDKALTPAATSGNNFNTTLALTKTPGGNSYIQVFVNGNKYVVGDAVATKDCYFATSGAPTTPLPIASVAATNILVWNGTLAGFQLAVTDVVDLDYSAII